MKAWMQLIRPSNVLTAISDVLAGLAIACLFMIQGLPSWMDIVNIVVSSMLLYTGGIVFNDVFDAKLDRIERPERPIPSGRIAISSASIFGIVSFVIACWLAMQVNMTCLYVALAIVVMCILYNGIAKHHFILGPIAMGMCRGLNLLLGFAVIPASLTHWYIALVPVIYIASVTNISRGEVYGNNKTALQVSLGLYLLVILILSYFAWQSGHLYAFIFIGGFVLMISQPLFKALKTLEPMDIRKAVKFGVLALILMNASWIALSGFWVLALAVCCILPLSIVLAKKFVVT
ncbi:UbiA-like protein EboC [Sphingobacteruim zhuxiongii]|uniref:UbiA-like protein EboC n=1 Tax=Sphingobacterium zhuxiongii TaxID=2662364 RepID=UPI0019232FAA|nr:MULTISPECIES: UbiA-like protein EboC [unclassified Sphingobacterium]